MLQNPSSDICIFNNLSVSINLLLTTCILWFVLLIDVLIDIRYVFTLYLINLSDTYRDISDTVFESSYMILMFCILNL